MFGGAELHLGPFLVAAGLSRVGQIQIPFVIEFRLSDLRLGFAQIGRRLLDIPDLFFFREFRSSCFGGFDHTGRFEHFLLVTGAIEHGEYLALLEPFSFFDEQFDDAPADFDRADLNLMGGDDIAFGF